MSWLLLTSLWAGWDSHSMSPVEAFATEFNQLKNVLNPQSILPHTGNK